LNGINVAKKELGRLYNVQAVLKLLQGLQYADARGWNAGRTKVLINDGFWRFSSSFPGQYWDISGK